MQRLQRVRLEDRRSWGVVHYEFETSLTWAETKYCYICSSKHGIIWQYRTLTAEYNKKDVSLNNCENFNSVHIFSHSFPKIHFYSLLSPSWASKWRKGPFLYCLYQQNPSTTATVKLSKQYSSTYTLKFNSHFKSTISVFITNTNSYYSRK